MNILTYLKIGIVILCVVLSIGLWYSVNKNFKQSAKIEELEKANQNIDSSYLLIISSLEDKLTKSKAICENQYAYYEKRGAECAKRLNEVSKELSKAYDNLTFYIKGDKCEEYTTVPNSPVDNLSDLFQLR